VAYEFEEQDSQNRKMSKLQPVCSIALYQLTFGFTWNYFEKFDLDGHYLGTIAFTADHAALKHWWFPQ
jgi:hypothetical protein